MHRAMRLLVLPALVLCACGPRPGAKCETQSCPHGQICDLATNLCVDDANPKVTIASPRDRELLSGSSVTLRATVSDDGGPLQLVEVAVGNGEWRPVDVRDGEVNVTLELPALDASPLALRVRATDSVGQTAAATTTPTIDNVAPSCAADGITNGQTLALANGPTFTLRFSVTDGSGRIIQPEVSVDDGTSFHAATLETNVARWDWNLPSENGTPHGVRFRARDEAGNACTVSLSTVVDTVAPTVSILAPDAGTLLGPASVTTVAVSGTAKDGQRPLPQLTVSLGGAPDGGVAQPAIDANGSWTADLPLPQDDHVERTITATATDVAGNSAQDMRRIRIDRVAPSVTFTAPQDGARFNIASFAQADGGSSNDVVVTFTVNDGDMSRTVQASINQGGFAPAQSPLTVQTSPADNGRTYMVEVRATDTAGNSTNAVHRFHVDRVRPALAQVVPDDRQRLMAALASITFTEPIETDGGTVVPVTFTPAVTGSWPSNTLYRASLANDTVYTATFAAGAVRDLFGNPNTVTKTWTFHTEPKAPMPGVLLNNVATFKAAHDFDGVVYFGVRRTGADAFEWWQVNPATGVPTGITIPIGMCAASDFDIAAWSSLRGFNLASRRIAGFAFYARTIGCGGGLPGPHGHHSYWLVDGAPASGLPTSAQRLIPIPPGCSETGAAETAMLKRTGIPEVSAYERPPNAASSLAFFADGVSYESKRSFLFSGWSESGKAWTAWRANGSNLEVQGWSCSTSQFPPYKCTCGVGSLFNLFTNLGTMPRVSTVLTSNGDGSLWVYDNNTGSRTEVCDLCVRVGGGFCQPGNNLTRPHPLAENLRVARRDTGSRVLGSRILSSPLRIELLERDLAPDCKSSWTSLGTVTLSGNVNPDAHQPVMFGSRPGVIYLEGTDLKAYVVP